MTLESTKLRELELLIADNLYIQICSWNLYLGDAGIAKQLAIECSAFLDQGASIAARKALEAVNVQLGGGQTTLPLSSLIPSGQIFELEEILESYCG